MTDSDAPTPAWGPDPTARHELRWWDGGQWTDRVADGRSTGFDPLEGSQPRTRPRTNPPGSQGTRTPASARSTSSKRSTAATRDKSSGAGLARAVKSGFRNSADFGGRATRSEYWWFQYFATGTSLTLMVLLSQLDVTLGLDDTLVGLVGLVVVVVWLALAVPLLAVGVRRLHDTGRSGVWMLWPLLFPLIIVVVVFLALPGDEKTNQYGPRPH